jgi:hypothetical protein
MEPADGEFQPDHQKFVNAAFSQIVFYASGEPEGGHSDWFRGFRETAMDWRTAMVRTDPPTVTRADELAYAAGWTISGLATLGTIIAVWLFAI